MRERKREPEKGDETKGKQKNTVDDLKRRNKGKEMKNISTCNLREEKRTNERLFG